MRNTGLAGFLALTLAAWTGAAQAFCGFYVAKADTRLFNEASKVVLVRDDHHTVLTMANNYRGDPQEFAVVVPVPTFIEREQIHVTGRGVIDHLDAYSAPRLVEYHDGDPCAPRPMLEDGMAMMRGAAEPDRERAEALGVTVEAQYTVGEYDILILSAEESAGLETWLRENGYRIPEGAARVLGSYIKQDMRFFVARVNLEKKSELGYTYLRPLQVAYDSKRFMLPIRLGTVNADGPQELFVFALTRTGRVETTNYRTVKLPANEEIPRFIKKDGEFARFYRAMFAEQTSREDMRVVFMEYAWDMSWCDPCAADPLSDEELRELGVYWVEPGERPDRPGILPRPQPVPKRAARDVFITRLHLRYTAETFPEDLRFQETGDRTNFQARYIIRHPWTGEAECEAAEGYWKRIAERRERQARTLASLTGWDVNEIRGRFEPLDTAAPGDGDDEGPWWKSLWK